MAKDTTTSRCQRRVGSGLVGSARLGSPWVASRRLGGLDRPGSDLLERLILMREPTNTTKLYDLHIFAVFYFFVSRLACSSRMKIMWDAWVMHRAGHDTSALQSNGLSSRGTASL